MIFYKYDDNGYGAVDPYIKEVTHELDKFTSVNVNVSLYCNIEIVKTSYAQNRIVIRGQADFVDAVRFSVKDDVLEIDIKYKFQTNVRHNVNNCITVYTCFDVGDKLNVSVGGTGSVSTTIPFMSGLLSVSGSGKIFVSDLASVKAGISGNGR